MAENKPVSQMNRAELNAHATSLGIQNAADMQNAGEVRAAIQQVSGGDPAGNDVNDAAGPGPNPEPLVEVAPAEGNANPLASPSEVPTSLAIGFDATPEPEAETDGARPLDVYQAGSGYLVGGVLVDPNGTPVKGA